MFFAYVLINSAGIYYKGSTENIVKRIEQHNSGQYLSYTKDKGPWELFYFEAFITREEALKRENFFKSKAGWYFLKMLREDRESAKIR